MAVRITHRLFLAVSIYCLAYCLLSVQGRYVGTGSDISKQHWLLPGMPDDPHIWDPYFVFFRLPWELDQRFIHLTISQ